MHLAHDERSFAHADGDTPLSDAPSDGDARILVFANGAANTFVCSGEGAVVVGRDPRCDVRILDTSVSRLHCRIAFGEEATAEDLGSLNGTVVEGVRIARGQKVFARPGRAIRLGRAEIVVFPPVRRRSSRVTRCAAPRATPHTGVPAVDPMNEVHALCDRVASRDVNVLLLGEAGTGKKHLAEAIHRRSKRSSRPFVVVDCATADVARLESVLFGYMKGITPGALASTGVLESARGGTVVLDRLGELPRELEKSLLRAVATGVIVRVGARRPRMIDVRFIATSRHDLHEGVSQSRRRADLFTRLSDAIVPLPPLRRRTSAIPPLAATFLSDASGFLGALKEVSPDALEALTRHAWPGNVAELRSVLERAVRVAPGPRVEAGDLGLPMSDALITETKLRGAEIAAAE